jgi:fluoride exporter
MIGIWIAAAGALGAVTRFVVDGHIRQRWSSSFPWATLVINVSGSLLLGVLTGLVLYRGNPVDLRLVLGTGFCGGGTPRSAHPASRRSGSRSAAPSGKHLPTGSAPSH